jgi:hypothetical protein
MQLLVSVGLPVALLIATYLAAIVIKGARSGREGAAAGLASFFVAICGYNALDVDPSFLVVAGLLVMGALETAGSKSIGTNVSAVQQAEAVRGNE